MLKTIMCVCVCVCTSNTRICERYYEHMSWLCVVWMHCFVRYLISWPYLGNKAILLQTLAFVISHTGHSKFLRCHRLFHVSLCWRQYTTFHLIDWLIAVFILLTSTDSESNCPPRELNLEPSASSRINEHTLSFQWRHDQLRLPDILDDGPTIIIIIIIISL